MVQHNEGLWTQKEGIFIGSSIAPALAECYLNSLDSVAVDMMQASKAGTLCIGRYVDDIIICTTKDNEISVIKQTLMASCPELDFTFEEPINDELQYLDLIFSLNSGLCWRYGRRSPKPLLSARSCHPKAIKRGLVTTLTKNVLKKSCCHEIPRALQTVTLRLIDAGYPISLIADVQKCITLTKRKPEAADNSHKKVVLPFFHDVSHNIKAVAGKLGVKVLFKNDLGCQV